MNDSSNLFRNIATFILVLMCIRYIPIESRSGVSQLKTVVSLLAPVIFLIKTPYLSKSLIYSFGYFICVLFSALWNYDSFRSSTILYLASLMGLFIVYYNLVYISKVFTLEYFTDIVKSLIIAYTVTLIIQQIFIVIGIKLFPLINLCQILDRGIGANSLSGEPSTAARILTVLFLTFIRLTELKLGRKKLKAKDLYYESKLVCIGFLWSMLTMGSGTAMVCLLLLSTYFWHIKYLIHISVISTLIIIIGNFIELEPLNRAIEALRASSSLNEEHVAETDKSASVRIIPIINTLTKLNLYKLETWIGYGTDAANSGSAIKTIGGISDYGLISYAFSFILTLKCVIKNFFSIEMLLFCGLFGATINNIAYVWGALMLFSSSAYFQSSHSQNINKN